MKAVRSTILSRRDLDFLLYEWLNVEELTKRQRYREHSRETFDGVLDLSEQLATTYFATHNKLADANEPTFDGTKVTIIPEVKRALDAFAEADLIGLTLDEEVGGSQLPAVVGNASFAWFHAANVATAGYPMLTLANANLVAKFGTPEQIDRFVRPMLAGRFHGTMALSEPQAGSSLADIVTRAEPQADGSYRVIGSKMWISGGEHDLGENIVHLVLAKIPGGPVGTKGISLFLVPKILVGTNNTAGERNDVVLAGLNHKMGFRGTVNTVLNFGEGRYTPDGKPGAVGYLIGEAHRGLQYMFHMMNEARVGVGLGATALGYTGFLKSLEYARGRPQGRPLTEKGAATPQIPIVEHADVRRMLLAQKSYAEGALALNLFCARLVDQQRTAESDSERDEATLLLDILTPIAKSWPSQWCLEANSLAIQVLGGAGYTREYDVEQHYRDNRLNPIHEGTHGIQSLDLLGRKVTQRDGASLRALGAALATTIAAGRESGDADATGFAEDLDVAWQRLVRGHHDAAGRRGSGDDARQQRRLSRGNRAPGDRVAVARAVPRHTREKRRLLRRQAAGDAVLLSLRTAEGRPTVRPARPPGPHDARDARRVVLTGQQVSASAAATRAATGAGRSAAAVARSTGSTRPIASASPTTSSRACCEMPVSARSRIVRTGVVTPNVPTSAISPEVKCPRRTATCPSPEGAGRALVRCTNRGRSRPSPYSSAALWCETTAAPSNSAHHFAYSSRGPVGQFATLIRLPCTRTSAPRLSPARMVAPSQPARAACRAVRYPPCAAATPPIAASIATFSVPVPAMAPGYVKRVVWITESGNPLTATAQHHAEQSAQ